MLRPTNKLYFSVALGTALLAANIGYAATSKSTLCDAMHGEWYGAVSGGLQSADIFIGSSAQYAQYHCGTDFTQVPVCNYGGDVQVIQQCTISADGSRATMAFNLYGGGGVSMTLYANQPKQLAVSFVNTISGSGTGSLPPANYQSPTHH